MADEVIPVPASAPVTVPETVYDRWDWLSVALSVNEATGKVSVGSNVCRANAEGFSPRRADRHNIQIPDLVARFKDNPEALAAIAAAKAAILVVVKAELEKRKLL